MEQILLDKSLLEQRIDAFCQSRVAVDLDEGTYQSLVCQVAIGAVEVFLNGTTHTALRSPFDELMGMGIPGEECINLLEGLNDLVWSAIARHTHGNPNIQFTSGYIYDVDIYSNDTLRITRREEVRNETSDPFSAVRDMVESEMEEGHYIPERIRRLVGV